MAKSQRKLTHDDNQRKNTTNCTVTKRNIKQEQKHSYKFICS